MIRVRLHIPPNVGRTFHTKRTVIPPVEHAIKVDKAAVPMISPSPGWLIDPYKKGSGDQCCQLQIGTSKIVVMYEFRYMQIWYFFMTLISNLWIVCEINSINFDLFFTSHSNPTESDLFVKLIWFHKDHYFSLFHSFLKMLATLHYIGRWNTSLVRASFCNM